MLFENRLDAGRRLAEHVTKVVGDEPVVVLGLPRGGVPVAFEVARALRRPLDVLVVRKLGVPTQPELAMGAIGEGSVRVVNEDVVRMCKVSAADFDAAEACERKVLEGRVARYRPACPRVELAGRVALIVDDGIATGATARAACQVARAQGAARVVVATPVAPPHTVELLRRDADEVIALSTPAQFFGIGQFYADFTQTSDDEVIRLLEDARTGRDEEVEVSAGSARLGGHLTVPDGAKGIVVFAHGSGSSRHSPRNLFVASVLNQAGLGTLLFDLLTRAEELDRTNVFDIELLARRLVEVTRWLRTQTEGRGVAIGYFGASTGAAAALWAAAEAETDIAAVVSRGGRPDLAGSRLAEVRAPTLLIVGGADTLVLKLNREAQIQLRCESELQVVPGATHLFEEPGTLAAAAVLARDWFINHLNVVGEPTG